MPKIVIVDTDFENNDFEVRMAKEAGVDIALFNEREPEAIIRNAADADGETPNTTKRIKDDARSFIATLFDKSR